MIFNRIWAMPNSLTFQIIPIKQLIHKYIKEDMVIIDPFANRSKIGTITNDLNPEYDTDYHMDALDFLKLMGTESADLVLYDPPYSLRQVVECYKGFGIAVTQEHTKASWRTHHINEIQRILKPGGICISFGWNSGGIGVTRGFKIIELLLVPHGGSRNDTIVTVEIKNDISQEKLNLI